MALKANHPTLCSQVTEWFETALADNFQGINISYDKRIEKVHHHREVREVWTVPVTAISELYQPKLLTHRFLIVVLLWYSMTNRL
ncbi:hypothetical protein H6G93_12555 [Nostoc sp. FACHB-973]|nr:hypothetical protein [Nostoc sp. FACHB-973]